MSLFRVPAPEEYLRKFPRGHCSELRNLYVYMLPGLGDHPEGTPLEFQEALCEVVRGMWIRPRMRYLQGPPDVPATICDWSYKKIPEGSMLVGMGLGGTVACGLQDYVKDLIVFAINAPMVVGDYRVHPAGLPGQRVALYNSNLPTLEGSSSWAGCCDDHADLPFLTQDLKGHLPFLATLIAINLRGQNMHEALKLL
jgi:hypothetical protein